MKTILLCPASKAIKSAHRDANTAASCSKAEPKKIHFAPPQTPFPGARDGQNSVSWRWSLHLPTNPVWCGSMHAISNYRGNRSTHPPANTARPPVANRQDRLQYTAPQLAHSVIRWVRTFLAYSVMQRLSQCTSWTPRALHEQNCSVYFPWIFTAIYGNNSPFSVKIFTESK